MQIIVWRKSIIIGTFLTTFLLLSTFTAVPFATSYPVNEKNNNIGEPKNFLNDPQRIFEDTPGLFKIKDILSKIKVQLENSEDKNFGVTNIQGLNNYDIGTLPILRAFLLY